MKLDSFLEKNNSKLNYLEKKFITDIYFKEYGEIGLDIIEPQNVVFLTPIVLYLFSAWFGAKKNLELGIDLKLVFEDQSANPIKLTYFNESAK